MVRSSAIGAHTLSAAILATVLGLGLTLTMSAAPAAAYDDDVDVVCFDYKGANGSSETECQTIEELTAECALVDPEFTTDVCGGLLESRRPLGLTSTNKHRRDNDSGKGNRGRDSGGGNSGGGNSGGGGSNGAGSGPNG